MNKAVLIGLGALSLLLFVSGSAAVTQAPAPVVPKPPPPPPPPKKETKGEPPPLGDFTFFNYSTGEGVSPGSFLDWSPGEGTPTPTPSPPSKPAPVLPKKGEKWKMVWSLNRPLSFLEMSAAKSAFRSYMTDQTLDSAMQEVGPPVTVALTTTFTKNAAGPIPIGQTIEKSGIVARLVSSKKIG